MFWICLFIGVFALSVYSALKGERKISLKLIESGYSPQTVVESGKLVGGHPDVNESIAKTVIYPKGDYLEIMKAELGKIPVQRAKIVNSSIKNVLAEDQSTVEKRVTVGRLLTVGVFAFALKKKKKNELSYLIIEWNDGRFAHETMFEFEGTGALLKANTARNKILKVIR